MQKDKGKKKTLTISSSFNKKFNPSSYGKTTKKSYIVEKKKSPKASFKQNRNWSNPSNTKSGPNNRNLNRKYVEQQATEQKLNLRLPKAGKSYGETQSSVRESLRCND